MSRTLVIYGNFKGLETMSIIYYLHVIIVTNRMKKSLLLALLAIGLIARAQNEYEIKVESKQPAGIIDEMLYGQLFEHIYFSANNGVWQELIQERSFEPE